MTVSFSPIPLNKKIKVAMTSGKENVKECNLLIKTKQNSKCFLILDFCFEV